MISFKQRSYQKELLDRDDIPFADIRQNMKELDAINSKLGGHDITLKGVRSFTDVLKSGGIIRILEIGCGGGDNLRIVKHFAERNGLNVQLSGVDINPECIAFARSRNENSGIDFACSDYIDYKPGISPDIIFSSLFCHHFTEPELLYMLLWMKENSRSGFFINDLHRHPLAYYSISFLTRLFSQSRLVKNDAPLSVKRGFRKEDWKKLFRAAGLAGYKIHWCWAFRWLITYHQ
jgi:SAM-dependent methyltransferase